MIWGAALARRHTWLFALASYCLIAVSLTLPAILGSTSLTPEGFLDTDSLYGQIGDKARLRPFEDPTPVVLELGREEAVAKGIQKGRLDSWNPWAGAGAPLWAEQGNPFFPTKLISFIYPHHSTLMAALAIRLVVAALGMYLLARALGLSRWAALLSGALLEYSGVSAANLPYANSSASYLLPWILLGAHKLCAERTPAAAAFCALSLGIAMLSGHPSPILLVCLAFCVWLVGDNLHLRPGWFELRRMGWLLVLVGVLSAMIAAVGLLPFAELLSHGSSYKNAEVSEAIWQQRLFWTRDVFTSAFFFPSLITATRDTMDYHMWPWAQGASIGTTAMLLAMVGVQKMRQHWGLILVGVLGVGLTLSPPGLQWLHQIPGVRIILPWYCYPLLIVPLCIAAGYGLQCLGEALRLRVVSIAVGVGLVGMVVAFAGDIPYGWQLKNEIRELLKLEVFTNPIGLEARHLVDWKTYISGIAGLLAIGAYTLLRKTHLAQAVLLVAAIAVVEAAAVRLPTVHFERSVVLRTTPSDAVAQLRSLLADGTWRFVGIPPFDVAAPNSGMLYELRDLRSFAALSVRRLTGFMSLAGTPEDDQWKRPQWQYPRKIDIPMLSLAAVKYIVCARQHCDPKTLPTSLVQLAEIGGVVILENPIAIPRFRIAHDVVPVGGEQEAFEALRRLTGAEPNGDTPAWAQKVVIEGLPADEGLRARVFSAASTTGEYVRRRAEPDPQTIVLEAKLDNPGFVVVADTYYPGWSATVNDVPTPIRPANLLFRAVAVPAGTHTIVMRYESSWLRLAYAISAIGLLSAGILMTRRATRGYPGARPPATRNL